MSPELEWKLEFHRKDFHQITGKPFEHFFCPILHVDEPTELLLAHVVNQVFAQTCRATVVGRKDVDNFFGSVAEADLVTAIRDRPTSLDKIWFDPALHGKLRPRIELGGVPIEHYRPGGKVPDNHTIVQVNGPDGAVMDIALKISSSEWGRLPPEDFQIVVERDFVPSVVASMIKAAHLTMFHMLGYQYVLSPSGMYVADVLAKFVRQSIGMKGKALKTSMNSYFSKHQTMVCPIGGDPDFMRGTVEDRRLLLIHGIERPFAIAVFVRTESERFGVFIPVDDGRALQTYASFLAEPPPSVAARLTRFVPRGEDAAGARWEGAAGSPIRVALNREPDGSRYLDQQ